MGTKKLQLFTLIVLCLSISLTLLFSVFSVLNIIIVKAIPPFIVLLLITVLCALLSLHCYRCKKFNEVKKHKLFKVNIALCCLFGICAFAMLSILFYTVIYLQVFFWLSNIFFSGFNYMCNLFDKFHIHKSRNN